MRTCRDRHRSSSGWYKGGMRSLVHGESASLGGREKNSFLLALLTSIHTGHLRHLPVYGIRLKRKSSKETNHSVMTAPGVNDTSPATCFFIFCGKNWPNSHLLSQFLGVGLALGWGVRRFHNNVCNIYIPTHQNVVNGEHPSGYRGPQKHQQRQQTMP